MTDTYNPILSKEDIKRWGLLQKRPTPEPGIALVLSSYLFVICFLISFISL